MRFAFERRNGHDRQHQHDDGSLLCADLVRVRIADLKPEPEPNSAPHRKTQTKPTDYRLTEKENIIKH